MTRQNKAAPVKTGVGVIVCRGHKVLVGERKGSHGSGLHSFPGGHVEPADASLPHPLGGLAARGEKEVFEETGIICRVFSPDHYRLDLFTTFDILSADQKKIYVTPYLVADYLHGGTVAVQEGEEIIVAREPNKCQAWHWLDLDQLATLVTTEEQRIWIPIHQVLHYLKQLWGLK